MLQSTVVNYFHLVLIDRAGIAVEGDVKHKNTSLASTTLWVKFASFVFIYLDYITNFIWLLKRIASQEARDAFGIIVSYAVKVKLFLGALGGELCAELPFILMHPKVGNLL